MARKDDVDTVHVLLPETFKACSRVLLGNIINICWAILTDNHPRRLFFSSGDTIHGPPEKPKDDLWGPKVVRRYTELLQGTGVNGSGGAGEASEGATRELGVTVI